MMTKHTLVHLCVWTSLTSTIGGLAMLMAALSQATTAEWGQVMSECTAQAVLIAGGLIALSICVNNIDGKKP